MPVTGSAFKFFLPCWNMPLKKHSALLSPRLELLMAHQMKLVKKQISLFSDIQFITEYESFLK